MIPRQAWRSRSQSYRVVVTNSGPQNMLHRVPEVPIDEFVVLEVREANDSLGNERWRMVDVYADQSAWRAAFHELASEVGLFSGGDVTEQVRTLLRGAEELSS